MADIKYIHENISYMHKILTIIKEESESQRVVGWVEGVRGGQRGSGMGRESGWVKGVGVVREGAVGREGVVGREGLWWAKGAIGLRERSDRLAASGAVEDWATRSAAQWSAARTARFFIDGEIDHTR